jgi:hypothetical protein
MRRERFNCCIYFNSDVKRLENIYKLVLEVVMIGKRIMETE